MLYKIYKKEQTTNGDDMKKILLMVSILLLITGCGEKEKKLNMEKLGKKLEELTTDKLDYINLNDVIEEPLDKIKIYSQEEIVEQLGIEASMYQNIFFCESLEGVNTYLVVEPKESEKEKVEALIVQYWNQKIAETQNEEEKESYQNRVEQSYGENLIYLVGKDCKKKLDKIKTTKQKLFPNLLVLEKTDLEKQLGLSIDEVESYRFAMSDKLDQVEQYIIIKYNKESEADIRKKVHDYFEGLEQEWKVKDDSNYQLLKNRMEKELDQYLIYLVSKDNKKAYQIIENLYE